MAFPNRDDKSVDPLRDGRRYVTHITYVGALLGAGSDASGGIDAIPGDKELPVANLSPTRCRSLISI
jgi:hypothetical protein